MPARRRRMLPRALRHGVAGRRPGLVVPVVMDAIPARSTSWPPSSNGSRRPPGRKLTRRAARGTFTVTSAGGLFHTPIVNHPEVAILGIGRIAPRPVARAAVCSPHRHHRRHVRPPRDGARASESGGDKKVGGLRGSWYWIGVAAGVGTGAGVAIGALIPEGRPGVRVSIAAVLAVAAGIGIGLLIGGWPEAAAGGIGGLLGALASVPVFASALRSGGTRLRPPSSSPDRRGRRGPRVHPGRRLRPGGRGSALRPLGEPPPPRPPRGSAHPRQGLTW